MSLQKEILYPMFALAGWTGIVLLYMVQQRLRATLPAAASDAVVNTGQPSRVAIANHNYMNLLEAPVLFYVACLILFVTGSVSATSIYLAWAYVGLRLLHSAVHLTYNKIPHRALVFAASNVLLIGLWLSAARSLSIAR